jgi:hypothetical protein
MVQIKALASSGRYGTNRRNIRDHGASRNGISIIQAQVETASITV